MIHFSGASLLAMGCFGFASLQALPLLTNITEACRKLVRPWPSSNAEGMAEAGKPWPGKWPPCLAGYSYHVASAMGEWSAALSFALYFLTYVKQFSHLSIGLSVVVATVDVSKQPLLPKNENEPIDINA